MSAGFSFEMRSDGVLVYHVADVRRETVDVMYAAIVHDDQDAADAGRHMLRLVVVAPGIIPTPYALAQVIAADRRTPPNLRESNAVIVGSGVAYQLMAVFVNRLPQKLRSATQVFHDEESALRWLGERARMLG